MSKTNTNTAVESKTSKTSETPVIKTKHLAAKFGIKPTYLRRVLRGMTQYADGVHTNYAWQGESDPAIALIAKAIEQAKIRKEKMAEEAKAKLAKARAAKAEQDKIDAKVKA